MFTPRPAHRIPEGDITLRLAVFVLAAFALVTHAIAASPVRGRAPVTLVDTLHLIAPGVSPSPLRVRVLLPPGYRTDASKRWPMLYLDDGQDVDAVELASTLHRLAHARKIRPPIVVAIDAPLDRLGAYGFSDRANARGIGVVTPYGTVGLNAHAYATWLTGTLVPQIDARYRTQAAPAGRTLLGWSLGAVSAFDIGWQYPRLFSRVGLFSPSLWLATDRSNTAASQHTRIGQQRVASAQRAPCVSLYIAVGTVEEKDDRDADGINDALDDVHDLVDGWTDGSSHIDGLRQRGLQLFDAASAMPARGTAATVTLSILENGEHRQSSWARMLPGFLQWAYAPGAHAPRCMQN